MKKNKMGWILGIFLLFIQAGTFAQVITNTPIVPYHLEVSYVKTTNLIFPYGIESADLGNGDVIAQYATGVKNILQLKAGKKNFQETNLTVVTKDGSFYSYLLRYSDNPKEINVHAENPQMVPKSVAVFNKSATNDLIKSNSEKIASRKQTLTGNRSHNHGAEIEIKGIYVYEDMLYFQFQLQNTSPIGYDVKMLRMFIKDRKKSKRTASQENEVNPVLIIGNTSAVRSKSEQVVVMAIPKFTIPDKKVFIVQMLEENGGRNLELKLTNKTIFKAKKLI